VLTILESNGKGIFLMKKKASAIKERKQPKSFELGENPKDAFISKMFQFKKTFGESPKEQEK